jgi:hypothetical protein
MTRPVRPLQIACFTLLALMLASAQPNPAPANYSGMYSFLREGEFVQINIEDNGQVIGFVSRYAHPESDSGFVDHLFKSSSLDGNHLAFTTETVNGVSFEFRGTFERGEGKTQSDEAYYLLKGTLIENTTRENTTGKASKTSSQPREVVLKSFPLDVAPAPAQKK